MKFSLAAAAAFLLAAVDAKTLLFPIPQTVDWTGSEAAVANNFEITGAKNAYVKDAAKRYTKLIFEESWVPVPISAAETLKSAASLKSLDISVKDNNAKLDTGIDESYELNVPSSGGKATLTANTWVGALRGLETFSQLVQRKKGGNKNQIAAHTAKITDAPTYGHRGIMLDTSRNFYPVKDILRTLDGMSMNKMNVLHWHATDSQSWPLYYKSHPEISKNGAYSQDEVYNPSDVQKIIKYAESRGIRVILELDMPAHTDTISMSHPDLMACHGMWWGPLASEPPSGQLNVIHKGTVDLMNELVSEALETFPDTYFHAGGDEINLKCWETNDEMTKYAKDKGVGLDQLWYDFTNNMIAHVKKGKKKSIIWEDSIKDGGKISTDTTVQTWLNPPGNYTSKGYDVIVTNYDYFYLDCGHGGWVGNDDRYVSPTQTETADDTFNYGGAGGSWCAPFKTWQRIYSWDMTYGIGKSDKGKVLGGEVALWAEQSGPTVVDGRLWPRAGAAAEVYWSGSYDNKGNRRSLKEVQPRFGDWTWRMIGRGFQAEPPQPKFCTIHTGVCDLNDPDASS